MNFPELLFWHLSCWLRSDAKNEKIQQKLNYCRSKSYFLWFTYLDCTQVSCFLINRMLIEILIFVNCLLRKVITIYCLKSFENSNNADSWCFWINIFNHAFALKASSIFFRGQKTTKNRVYKLTMMIIFFPSFQINNLNHAFISKNVGYWCFQINILNHAFATKPLRFFSGARKHQKILF